LAHKSGKNEGVRIPLNRKRGGRKREEKRRGEERRRQSRFKERERLEAIRNMISHTFRSRSGLPSRIDWPIAFSPASLTPASSHQ
jgi:hypothetical protein